MPIEQFLELTTYIGVTISCLCFLGLILTRFSCRSEKPESENDSALRNIYMLNAICHLVSNLMILVLLKFSLSDIGMSRCVVLVSFLHFFLLSAFGFSLAAAWQHYLKLIRIFQPNRVVLVSSTVKSIGIGAVFSLAALFFRQKSNTNKCIQSWLPTQQFYYFFLTPLVIILSLAFFFYLVVIVGVLSVNNKFCCCFSRTKSVGKKIIKISSYNHKKVIVLLAASLVLSGLTWLVGLAITIADKIEQPNLKLASEFLFFLTTSFHGLGLLLGNLLAKKYSKASMAKNKAAGNKRNSGLREEDELNMIEPPPDIELTFSVRMFLVWYRMKSWVCKLVDFRSGRYPNSNDGGVGGGVNENQPSFVEFSVVNYDEKTAKSRHIDYLPDAMGINNNNRQYHPDLSQNQIKFSKVLK